MRRRRQSPLAYLAAVIAILIAGWLTQNERADRVEPRPTAAAPQQSEEQAAIQETLDLIARGGPFPHRQDGTVFQNREGRLPSQPRGYYREYTVRTAGAKNRGARRIVTGQNGEKWYTRDHYRTFVPLD